MPYRRLPVLLAALLLVGVAPGCRGDDGGDGGGGAGGGGMGGDGGVSPHPGEVWVMTWNLQLFPKTAATPMRVVQILGETPADLVAVQEIDDSAAFMALDEALPEYTALMAGDPFSDTRVGLLYRHGTISIDRVETIFIDDDYAFPLPPLLVHATAQEIDFTVVVLHLKALGDFESEMRRKDAVIKLDAWMSMTLAGGGEQDIVMLGDWNDRLVDPPADNVFAPMLAKPSVYTFLTLPLAEREDQDGGTYIPFESFIDHVLITEDLKAELGSGGSQVLKIDASDAQYESAVSDHRPVLTRFIPAP